MTVVIPAPNIQRSTTLIDLIHNVCLELGIPLPPSAMSSADPQITQLMAIARRLGKDLVREFEWEQLIQRAVVNTIPGVREYPLPMDWNRQIEQTEWAAYNRQPLAGPLTPQRWATYQAWNLAGSLCIAFRIINGNIVLLDDPGTETLSYEYISENWVLPESGPAQNTFRADSDSFVFDDALMQAGLLLRWRKAKGLDYDESDYFNTLALCKSQNKSAPVLSLSPHRVGRLIDQRNVPETGYGA